MQFAQDARARQTRYPTPAIDHSALVVLLNEFLDDSRMVNARPNGKMTEYSCIMAAAPSTLKTLPSSRTPKAEVNRRAPYGGHNTSRPAPHLQSRQKSMAFDSSCNLRRPVFDIGGSEDQRFSNYPVGRKQKSKSFMYQGDCSDKSETNHCERAWSALPVFALPGALPSCGSWQHCILVNAVDRTTEAYRRQTQLNLWRCGFLEP
ncbi:hypothetical protein DAEQUDRAFT_736328 [Daedalea quercina L-15889]|uniref:Uncharacterized protein n=1 Tax=Daedalea quercina L-15889 TaxID=1314783 RepID=A0A165SLM8_9APHY|nr:hypothetical protein DAEQUDRAFT_736328 [Daedalea quercina L-15889]